MKEIKRGQMYYANLCPVVGSEQGRVRPVVILQNNTGNRFSPTTIVAAVTSKKINVNLPTHVRIKTDGLKSESTVLLEQIRTIDCSRLQNYIGIIDSQTMEKIDHAIVISLGLEYLEMLKK